MLEYQNSQCSLNQAFKNTQVWVFDLDNTLYPAECNLFAEVDQRMGDFISNFLNVSFEEARHVQKKYYYEYGTTLAGLMEVHKLEPKRFLDYVHDIDLSPVQEAPELAQAITELPGRKFIFTNGSRKHAENVAGKLGVLDRFEDIFDIAASDYVPKPHQGAYDKFLQAHNVKASSAAMFEDLPHNLKMPHSLGMVTVLIRSSYFDHPAQKEIEREDDLPEHIHHITENLEGFLSKLTDQSMQT